MERDPNKEYCELHTNIVYNGRVAYRAEKIEPAQKAGLDLICFSLDRPGEYMIVPNFLIGRRCQKRKKLDHDKTGWEGYLYDIWWTSEQDNAKKVDVRQQKLL